MIIQQELQLASIARQSGARLTHYYNQGRDARIDKDDLTSGGWCYAMAAKWLLNDNSSDFWRWMTTTEAEMRLRTTMARQAIVKAQLRGVRGSDRNSAYRWSETYKTNVGWDTALEERGVRDNSDLLKNLLKGGGVQVVQTNFKYGTDASGYWRLGFELGSSARTKFGIGLFYDGGGAHQVAAKSVDSNYLYMDPNLGEFRIPKDRFTDFMFNLEFDYGLSKLSCFEVAHCN